MGESVLLAGVCLCVRLMSVFVSAFRNAFVFLSYIRVCYVLIYLHHMCLCVICVCANMCTHICPNGGCDLALKSPAFWGRLVPLLRPIFSAAEGPCKYLLLVLSHKDVS